MAKLTLYQVLRISGSELIEDVGGACNFLNKEKIKYIITSNCKIHLFIISFMDMVIINLVNNSGVSTSIKAHNLARLPRLVYILLVIPVPRFLQLKGLLGSFKIVDLLTETPAIEIRIFSHPYP